MFRNTANVQRPREPVLHPNDLLMHKGPGLFPAGFQHRLTARGVPAIPGGIFGDGFRQGGRDESVVKLGPLRTVVRGRAVGRRPILVPGWMVRAVVVDEIRRVGRKQDRPFTIHQAAHVGRAGAVTAQQAVIAEDPEISGPRGRIARRFGDGHRRHRTPGTTLFTVPLRHVGQDIVQFAIGETDMGNVIVVGEQVLQFCRKPRLVPLSPIGGLVGKQPERPDLGFRQLVRQDHRHSCKAQQPCRLEPEMPIDNQPVAAGDNRNAEAEFHNGLRHPVDHVILLARISVVFDQPADRPVFKLQRGIEHLISGP